MRVYSHRKSAVGARRIRVWTSRTDGEDHDALPLAPAVAAREGPVLGKKTDQLQSGQVSSESVDMPSTPPEQVPGSE